MKALHVQALHRILGISFFLQLFYLIGHYVYNWPFPTPVIIFQLFITVTLGVILGILFAKIWPLPQQLGFERVVRTLLIVIPALGIGIGLQLILQGNMATQAIYLIFSLSAWLGSGQYIRKA